MQTNLPIHTELDYQIRLLSIAVEFEQRFATRPPDHDQDAMNLAWCAWQHDAVTALRRRQYDGFDNHADYEKYGNSFVPLRRDRHAGQGATSRLVCRSGYHGHPDDV